MSASANQERDAAFIKEATEALLVEILDDDCDDLQSVRAIARTLRAAGQATEPDAHIHLFRKIGGGRHYEQANLGGPNQNPDPEDGFEWYGSKPLYLRAAGQVIPEPPRVEHEMTEAEVRAMDRALMRSVKFVDRVPVEVGVTVEATHELKCWPGPFSAMQSGAKTAEFRQNDRDYSVGDTLLLNEWSPDVGYTGKTHGPRRITHILGHGVFGIPAGYVMLSLAALSLNQPSPLVKAEALALLSEPTCIECDGLVEWRCPACKIRSLRYFDGLDNAFTAEFDLLPEDAKPLCDTFYRSLRKRLGHSVECSGKSSGAPNHGRGSVE